jgi:hypothetical protein
MGGPMTELESLQWCTFQNDASTAVPAYGIMRITGIVITEGKTFLTVDQPNASTTAYAVNGPAEVAANGYGQCVLLGPCVFQYDTGTPAFNDFYSAKSGQWTASKTGNLIRCLGIIDATNKFALGVIGAGSGDSIIGKLDGDLNYNSTATVSVWTGAINSESDSGENITSVGCRWISSGKKLASGSWVKCDKINGNWYVTVGPCEVAQ